jgi:hypothetical protein
MATLDKGQKSLLKRLIRENDGWDVLELALAQYIDEIQREKVTGSSEFETLRMLHTNQGKVDGLKEFFERVERVDFE